MLGVVLLFLLIRLIMFLVLLCCWLRVGCGLGDVLVLSVLFGW